MRSAPRACLSAVEHFRLAQGQPPDDLAVAIRVGALDGRHPELEAIALRNISNALVIDGRLLIDGGDPLRALALPPVSDFA